MNKKFLIIFALILIFSSIIFAHQAEAKIFSFRDFIEFLGFFRGRSDNSRATTTMMTNAKITPEALVHGKVGQTYRAKLKIHSNETRPKLTWSIVSGILADGLKISPDAGVTCSEKDTPSHDCLNADETVIYGVPTKTGTYSFTVRAQTGNGVLAERAYRLTINAAPADISDYNGLAVVSPTAGETWQTGTEKNIGWTYTCEVLDCMMLIEPKYTVKLLPYYPPCATNVCPLYPEEAPFTIAKNVSGGWYKWTVGKVLENRLVTSRQYLIEVCWEDECDRTDKPFTISAQNTTTTNNTYSCGKPTIFVYVNRPGWSGGAPIDLYGDARNYFYSNSLDIVAESGDKFTVDPKTGSLEYWINKIQADGIGRAEYDTVGCDWQ